MAPTVHIKTINGYYLQAEGGGGSALTAAGPWPREWETITIVPEAGGWADIDHGSRVRLRAPNGQYVAARGADGRLDATARDGSSAETLFTVELLPGEPRRFDHFSRFALRAGNGRFVCAENGGNGIVVANRTALGPWETFEARWHPEPADCILTTGIRSVSGMHFLQAEEGGGSALNARGPWVQTWETFDIVAADRTARGLPNGAHVNVRTESWHYLQAEGGGGAKVTAGGPWPREHETFALVVPGRRLWLRPEGTFGLRTHNGRFVEAEGGGGAGVNAVATTMTPRATFTAAHEPAPGRTLVHQTVGTVSVEDVTTSTSFTELRAPGHHFNTARTGTFVAQLVGEARMASPGTAMEVQVTVDGKVANPGPATLTSDATYAGRSYTAFLGSIQPGWHTVTAQWRVTAGRGHMRKRSFTVSVLPD